LGGPGDGAVCVEAAFDSGAVNHVASPRIFPGKMRPSRMSKLGKSYRGPDSSPIPNMGEQTAKFTTEEGHKCGLIFQFADIERPLIAVAKVAAGGNVVELGEHGGTITHKKSGQVTKVHRRGGVYVLKMWVMPEPKDTPKHLGFPRQGD
jgi:hypothetical protein